MKIAEVTPVYPPYKGGIGMVCAQNARALASLGYDVTVVTPRYTTLKNIPKSSQEKEAVTVKRLTPLFQRGNAALLPQLLWSLAHYDAIHLHYPFIDATSATLLAKALWKGKKLVVTYHMDLVGKGLRAPLFRLYTALIVPLLTRLADTLIVTSWDYARHSHLAPYLKRYKNKIQEIPNSVDIGRFFPTVKKQELLELHGISTNEKVILFVGGLDTAHYFKGVDHLLSAFFALSSAVESRLIIVGDGDLKPIYQKKAVTLGIADRVVFTGSISNEQLVDMYNLSDVVVLPSIDASEAFGVVLIEAGACAKPVIASSLPGVRSVVDDGVSGLLIEPGNTRQLARALHDTLTDDEYRSELGKAGRRKVEELYSYDAIKQKLTDIFI